MAREHSFQRSHSTTEIHVRAHSLLLQSTCSYFPLSAQSKCLPSVLMAASPITLLTTHFAYFLGGRDHTEGAQGLLRALRSRITPSKAWEIIWVLGIELKLVMQGNDPTHSLYYSFGLRMLPFLIHIFLSDNVTRLLNLQLFLRAPFSLSSGSVELNVSRLLVGIFVTSFLNSSLRAGRKPNLLSSAPQWVVSCSL